MTSTRAEEKAEYIEALSQSLAKVGADRQVLDSREFRMMCTAREKGLTYAEIGKVRGCTAQSVEQWFSRRNTDGQLLPKLGVQVGVVPGL